jgi:hypothetical protein
MQKLIHLIRKPKNPYLFIFFSKKIRKSLKIGTFLKSYFNKQKFNFITTNFLKIFTTCFVLFAPSVGRSNCLTFTWKLESVEAVNSAGRSQLD